MVWRRRTQKGLCFEIQWVGIKCQIKLSGKIKKDKILEDS